MIQGDRVKVIAGFFKGRIGYVVESKEPGRFETLCQYRVRLECGWEVNFLGGSCLKSLSPLELLAEAAV